MKLKFSLDSVYIASEPVDFRKGIQTLSDLVADQFDRLPTDKSLYIFTNRRQDRIKCLYYDGTGFWLLYKVLNEGSFNWHVSADGLISITRKQLDWLLSGLSIESGTVFRDHAPLYA